MDFTTAVRTCFSKYADFSGRARRSEFWYFVLFTLLLGFVSGILDATLGTGYDTRTGGVVNTLVSLVLLPPMLAVAVRRLHDVNVGGRWLLMFLIPILGWIALIIWFRRDTVPGDNLYGPDPKNAAPDPGRAR